MKASLSESCEYAVVQPMRYAPTGTLTSVDVKSGWWNVAGSEALDAPPVPISAALSTVTFEKTGLIIAPGHSEQFTAIFNEPQGLDPCSIPIYSDFINITSDDPAGSAGAMYAGVADDLNAEHVVDNSQADAPNSGSFPCWLTASATRSRTIRTFLR